MSPPSAICIDRHKPIRALIERAQAMPKQGASSGFKYGRAVGAIEAVITLCEIPVTIVEPSVWKRFRDSPARTRKAAAARPAAVSGRACGSRAQERPWPGRGIVDRAVRGQVIMNAPLEPAHSPFGGSVAARVLRCPASVGLVEKVPAHLRKVFEPMPSGARRSIRQWPF